jgi:hypothetical protein
VPESAIIDTGAQKIIYRETIPGTFDGVRVKVGPRMMGADGQTLYPILDGLARGDRFVAIGSFLVDAETRLNPAAGSIYFGGSGGSKSGQSSASTVRPSTPEDEEAKITAALAQLPEADRRIAEAQRFCPVLEENRLGSMGVPVKLMIEGQPVFLCCGGCKKGALANPEKTLAQLAAQKPVNATVPSEMPAAPPADADDEADISANLAKLSAADRAAASAQKFCVILSENRLGSMGTPIKLSIQGQTVFLCCAGCQKKALANPKASVSKATSLKAQNREPATPASP